MKNTSIMTEPKHYKQLPKHYFKSKRHVCYPLNLHKTKHMENKKLFKNTKPVTIPFPPNF